MNIYNDTDKSSNSDLSGESTKIENCWNGDQELELNIIISTVTPKNIFYNI